jgi:hypothetical protein
MQAESMPKDIDPDDPWKNRMRQDFDSKIMPVAGACLSGEHLYYMTTNRQIFKMRHVSERPD